MARTWGEVKAEALASGLIDEERVAAARERTLDALRAYRLAEIRRAHRLTQKALAAGMKVSQARVSTIERGRLDKTELGTLQAYVEALGGHLKVVAEFGDTEVVVCD